MSKITKLDNAVALVQEPWISNNRILGLNIKNSTIYRGSNSDSRTCVIVKGLQAYNLPQLGSRDTTVVCVTYNHNGRLKFLLVASIYMAIDKGLPVAELDNIIRHSDSTGIPVVIAGDSNAHHPAWGCQEQNARGLALSEFLAATELEILNKGCEYTFCSNNKRSIIDVTMASRTLLQYMYDWHVDNQDTMSDHRQICFALRRDRPNSKRIRNRRSTNCTVYEQEVEGKVGMWFGTINNPTDIETELTKVSSASIRSFEKACPERKIGKRNRVLWWNRELKILRQKAN